MYRSGSIESDPDNLIAVNTLAGMGILTEDDSLLDAALSEILALPIHERHERDPGREVAYLLVQHHLGQVRQPSSSSYHVPLTYQCTLRATFETRSRSLRNQWFANQPARRAERT